MTLDEIRKSDKLMLIPGDVAEVLGCDQHSISLQARENPRLLGFPVCVLGSRVKIPREAFLKWVSGSGMWDATPDECRFDYDTTGRSKQ